MGGGCGIVSDGLPNGFLVEEATWKAVVVIPKGGGDYCGIGLVEVLWKAVEVIINHRLHHLP